MFKCLERKQNGDVLDGPLKQRREAEDEIYNYAGTRGRDRSSRALEVAVKKFKRDARPRT